MHKIAIALGGNSGSEEYYFLDAREALADGGVFNICISSLYLNPAVDCIPGTPDFKNAALTGETDLTPEGLLKLCQKIEFRLGRPSVHRSDVSRSIDLDIILYDSLILHSEKLTIPHKKALERDFVLVPLAEIAEEMVFPNVGFTVKECLEHLKRRKNLRASLSVL